MTRQLPRKWTEKEATDFDDVSFFLDFSLRDRYNETEEKVYLHSGATTVAWESFLAITHLKGEG